MALTPSLEIYNITDDYEILISFTGKLFKSDMSSIHFADFGFTKKNTRAKYFTCKRLRIKYILITNR